MLQRVMIDGIELPRLYIAENRSDVELAKSKGIPFVRWTSGQEALIKMLLRPVLEKMFPFIKWNAVLGYKPRKFKTKVEICEAQDDTLDQLEIHEESDDDASVYEESTSDDVDDLDLVDVIDERDKEDEEDEEVLTEVAVACSDERTFSSKGTGPSMSLTKLNIEDYIGDMNSYVNIDILQRLRLMPAFLGNILDCVKINIGSGLYWNEGYNKRLGLPVGRFNSSKQLPNLIILDVSGSIPRGISATMISLIDTLRSQLSADLIITSSISRFYPMGSELPSPNSIRQKFGYQNEAEDFFRILSEDVRGKHYGHVFSFGDNDCPEYYSGYTRTCPSLAGTIVEHVHHYHTGTYYGNKEVKTGYAKWCHILHKKPLEEYDTSWCRVIKD